jgi:hypothetical protein
VVALRRTKRYAYDFTVRCDGFWGTNMAREIPNETVEKWLAWKHWSNHWNTLHYITGFSSAALTVVIAANAKAQFMGPLLTTILAGIAAGLTFLVTAFGAQIKGKGFEVAGRELEVAMAKYRTNPDLPDSFLGEAEARGVEILNNMK